MDRLRGKTAIVTGAASGIGRATVRLFAAEGARVVIADLNDAAGEAIVRELRSGGFEALFVHTDVALRRDAAKLIESTVHTFGGIDILVNGAAIGVFNKRVDNTEEDEWDRTLAINLKSVYLISKEAIPHLRARGGGVIINISSIHAYLTSEGVAAYAAAKGGVLALTRQMALDYTRDGIRVNCVIPGAVDTPMLHSHAERMGVSLEALGFSFDPHAIGRVARPDELARGILFLATDDSSFMVGAPLILDGGLLTKF